MESKITLKQIYDYFVGLQDNSDFADSEFRNLIRSFFFGSLNSRYHASRQFISIYIKLVDIQLDLSLVESFVMNNLPQFEEGSKPSQNEIVDRCFVEMESITCNALV